MDIQITERSSKTWIAIWCKICWDLLSQTTRATIKPEFSAPTRQSFILVTFSSFEDDIPLTRHNFAQQAFRLWKSSLVAPMGTNLAVIRYEWVICFWKSFRMLHWYFFFLSCADGDNDVLFLFNEKPLQIAGCQSNGLCKQSLILQRFSRFLDGDCSELFCSNVSDWIEWNVNFKLLIKINVLQRRWNVRKFNFANDEKAFLCFSEASQERQSFNDDYNLFSLRTAFEWNSI